MKMSVETLSEGNIVVFDGRLRPDQLDCHGDPPGPVGQRYATSELFSDLYEELKTIARNRLVGESSGHTLQSSALVNECYLRMLATRKTWINRKQFFCVASVMMRRILVDSARSMNRHKRGGGYRRHQLDENSLNSESDSAVVAGLEAALEKLAVAEPRKAELVKLRFFDGMTNRQAAKELGVGLSTAERYWSYARAWLKNEMTPVGTTS